MRKPSVRIAIGGGLLLWICSGASGQKATEIYTPIGQSPGLSGKYTVIGTIESVSSTERVLTIAGESERWSATVTERTQIWLDRSPLRLKNEYGSFDDLKEGLRAEVKYEQREHRGSGPAEWIKVQPKE